MSTENMAVVQGWADTRSTLRRWSARPVRPLLPWALGSLAVALLLIAATWVVASLTAPDSSRFYFPGLYFTATIGVSWTRSPRRSARWVSSTWKA